MAIKTDPAAESVGTPVTEAEGNPDWAKTVKSIPSRLPAATLEKVAWLLLSDRSKAIWYVWPTVVLMFWLIASYAAGGVPPLGASATMAPWHSNMASVPPIQHQFALVIT
jgi:hypothetical protein